MRQNINKKQCLERFGFDPEILVGPGVLFDVVALCNDAECNIGLKGGELCVACSWNGGEYDALTGRKYFAGRVLKSPQGPVLYYFNKVNRVKASPQFRAGYLKALSDFKYTEHGLEYIGQLGSGRMLYRQAMSKANYK